MNDSDEDKNYITSYAFGVNSRLLGKPLARPIRRLLSIFIDTVVVSSLTLMSTTVMAICIFMVSIVGYIKAKKKEDIDGRESFAPQVLGVSAILSGIVVVTSLMIGDINIDIGSPDAAENAVQTDREDELDKPDLSTNNDTADDIQTRDRLSIIAWAQAVLTDLGLGFGWAALYFSVFVAWFNGQTIGKMLLRIRVVKIDGREISLWESFGRYGGYSAGLATGLTGFLQVLWDPNRQAIHDKISETVVIDLRKSDRAT